MLIAHLIKVKVAASRISKNPYIRTESISAVIDYLTTLSYVDNTRIGAMGICAGAGYTANAAIQDRRIKAIGTVSADDLVRCSVMVGKTM